MQQVDRDSRAGRRQRMADGDRAATHIRAAAIESELALHGEILRRERLVHLDEVHLLEFHLRPLEGLASGRNGTDAHMLRLDAGDEAYGRSEEHTSELQSRY